MINLKIERVRNNYTREHVAKICETTASTIGRWETGVVNPPIQTLIKLADLFNVSIDYLVGRKDNE